MPNKTHHVTPNSEKGGWDVKKGNHLKTIKHFERKEDAMTYARTLAKHQDSDLVVQKKDGKFQRKHYKTNPTLWTKLVKNIKSMFN